MYSTYVKNSTKLKFIAYINSTFHNVYLLFDLTYIHIFQHPKYVLNTGGPKFSWVTVTLVSFNPFQGYHTNTIISCHIRYHCVDEYSLNLQLLILIIFIIYYYLFYVAFSRNSF